MKEDVKGNRRHGGIDIKGASHLVLSPKLILLQPEEQVWEAMCRGWQKQQTSRLLKAATIDL